MTIKGKLQQFNSPLAGAIAGIVLPVIVYFILYYAKIQDVRFTLFSNNLVIGNIIPIILSHCILPNMVLFFILNSFDWINAAKGVLGSTLVLTVTIFGIKLIFSLI